MAGNRGGAGADRLDGGVHRSEGGHQDHRLIRPELRGCDGRARRPTCASSSRLRRPHRSPHGRRCRAQPGQGSWVVTVELTTRQTERGISHIAASSSITSTLSLIAPPSLRAARSLLRGVGVAYRESSSPRMMPTCAMPVATALREQATRSWGGGRRRGGSSPRALLARGSSAPPHRLGRADAGDERARRWKGVRDAHWHLPSCR